MNGKPTEIPMPPPFAEPALTPLASVPTLPVHPTPDPTETQEIAPSPRLPSPSSLPLQSIQERLIDHDEDTPEEEPNLCLSQPSAASSPPTASPPVPSIPMIEIQQSHGVAPNESEEYKDGLPAMASDLPRSTGVVSDGVGGEGFSSNSVDIGPAGFSMPPPFTSPPLPLSTPQPVLQAQLTPDLKDASEPVSFSQPLYPPCLPQQSFEEGSNGLNNKEDSSDEHDFDEEDGPDEVHPDEEESETSLSVGLSSVAHPLSLTTPPTEG